ncbi:hypothetical protein GGG17_10310 [Arsenicicoccus sp. MKL-02]|uniref:Uncharacterized protein n=1 Tax=Arsenicicoccus cauae TaxID=2663847 RepID=A0A6I3IKZ0_9MICO|nr:hypothetical protein [Arsenicicoccus cauae]MTB72355.1 hypothetical protein [Arsenicicoccus cauae]
MITPAGGRLRLLRAGTLAVVMLALAALAHLLGAGALPGPGVLAVLLGLVLATCLTASARRLGAGSIGAILGGGQLALHGAFTVLGTTGADPESLGHVVGSGHHAVLVTHAWPAHAAAGGHGHLSLTMLLAHVLATVVTAAVLARGERALWLLASWLAPVIRLLLDRPAHWARPAAISVAVSRLRSAELVLAAPRRGPPLVVCAR